jgi:hypothetical protein
MTYVLARSNPEHVEGRGRKSRKKYVEQVYEIN